VVVVSAERWAHICEAHPELEAYRSELLTAIAGAVHVLPGRAAGEEWFYAECVGPSRRRVVISFTGGETGRIITAFAGRRKP
jgi:hypothetical protein